MFWITLGRGFMVTFANGWTVSVQFGPANYCDNRSLENTPDWMETARKAGEKGCANAEIAAWDADDNWHDFGDDRVKGYVTPNEVLEFMNMIAAK